MRLILGILAATAAGQYDPAVAAGPDIAYEVKILDMKGLEWRSTFYGELQTVISRDGFTAWTTPSANTGKLASAADAVVAAPKIRAFTQARARMTNTTTHKLVGAVDRRADGPVNHASSVAFVPHVESQTEGNTVQVAGRKLDQGVLTQVDIEDRQVCIHKVQLSEGLQRPANEGGGRRVGVGFEVPEITSARITGEWLIPNDCALVVSLGVHTTADAQGRAVVRERLAVIEAKAVEAAPVQQASFTPTLDGPMGLFEPDMESVQRVLDLQRILSGVRAMDEAAIPLPAPALPSRSLPQGLTAAGVPVALPPLPDDVNPPTALPDSAEACATPQFRGEPVGDPVAPRPTPLKRDDASKLARFVDGPECCNLNQGGAADLALPTPIEAGSLKGKEVTFRVPLGDGLMIEVHATARPLPYATVPPPPLQPAK